MDEQKLIDRVYDHMTKELYDWMNCFGYKVDDDEILPDESPRITLGRPEEALMMNLWEEDLKADLTRHAERLALIMRNSKPPVRRGKR